MAFPRRKVNKGKDSRSEVVTVCILFLRSVLNQVKSGAIGVAFCRHDAALPVLADRKALSPGALALLVIGGGDTLLIAQARLRCQLTTLVLLTHLGSFTAVFCSLVMSRLRRLGPAPEVGALPTKVVRTQVFKDEFQGEWRDSTKRPIPVRG